MLPDKKVKGKQSCGSLALWFDSIPVRASVQPAFTFATNQFDSDAKAEVL